MTIDTTRRLRADREPSINERGLLLCGIFYEQDDPTKLVAELPLKEARALVRHHNTHITYKEK